MDNSPLLQAKALTMSYQNNPPILENAEFFLMKGEAVLLMGDNGSGKTSFVKAIAQRHQPGMLGLQMGEVKFFGECRIALIDQRPSNQMLTGSVKEELATPFSFAQVPRSIRKKQVERTLEKFGIFELKERDPYFLSSGQQQLVNLATISQMEADLIVLDEPFALLDEQNTVLLVELLKMLKNKGVSLIVIQHRPHPLSLTLYDRVYELKQNRIEEIQEPKFQGRIEKTMMQSWVANLMNITEGIIIGRDRDLFSIPMLLLGKRRLLVVGNNGSGKTTFLLTLYGSIKTREGVLPEFISETKKVFVPQDSTLFFTKQTVEAEWAFVVGKNLPLPEPLLKFRNRTIFSLSEGEKKWISLLIAFSSEADLLLLDEPSYALDNDKIQWLKDKLHHDNRMIILSTNESYLFMDIEGDFQLIRIEPENESNHVASSKLNITQGYETNHSLTSRLHPIALLTLLFPIMAAVALNNQYWIFIFFCLEVAMISMSEGLKALFEKLWKLKLLLVAVPIFHYLLTTFPYPIELIVTTQFVLRLLVLFLLFSGFGQTIPPDEFVDSLLTLRFPANFAWSIGSVYRQSVFLGQELAIFQDLHRPPTTNGWLRQITAQIEFSFNLLTAAFSLAIDRANGYANSLLNRGWQGAHRTIICYSRSFSKHDMMTMLISGVLLAGVIFS